MVRLTLSSRAASSSVRKRWRMERTGVSAGRSKCRILFFFCFGDLRGGEGGAAVWGEGSMVVEDREEGGRDD